MGTRITCQCGNPLPCPKHTGDDGDTADRYNPDINEDNPGTDEEYDRHGRS